MEGGRPELLNRLDKNAAKLKANVVDSKNKAALKTADDMTSNSDITQKPVSDITAGNNISIR